MSLKIAYLFHFEIIKYEKSYNEGLYTCRVRISQGSIKDYLEGIA